MMRREIRKIKEQNKNQAAPDVALEKRVAQLEVDLAVMRGQMSVFQEHIDKSLRMSEMAKKSHKPKEETKN